MKSKFTLVMTLVVAVITNTNAQWANVATNSTKSLRSVAFFGNQGLIGGTNGTIIHSADGGLTWDDSLYYNYDPVDAVAFASATLAVAGSYKMYNSINGGATFSGPYTVTNFNDFRDITFRTPTDGIAVDNFCQLARSTDGGQNWTASTIKPCGGSAELKDIDFPTSLVGYFCGHNGSVFKSTDGGALWLPVTAPGASNVNYKAIGFTDANTGFITGKTTSGQDTFVFKKTIDGGTSWIDLKKAIIAAGVKATNIISSFSFLNSSIGYLIDENKIYKTTDGGTTWSLDFTSTAAGNAFFNKIVATPNVVMAVGQSGVAARLAGTSTGINEVNNTQEIFVYPNPSNNIITIGNIIINNESAFVEITDISGRKVKEEKISDNHLDISSFPKGLYFGKLYNGNGINNNFKFMKQ